MSRGRFLLGGPLWLSILVVGCVLVAGAGWVIRDQYAQVRHAADEHFTLHQQWLRAILGRQLPKTDRDQGAEIVRLWASEQPEIVRVRMVAPDGRVLLDYQREAPGAAVREADMRVGDSASGLAILLAVDQAEQEAQLRSFTQRILALSLMVFSLAAVLLQQRHLRQMQAEALDRANRVLADEALERERARADLQRLQAAQRLILDTIAEGIYGVDCDGRCTFINPAAVRLLGYPAQEALLGKVMHAVIHHHHADGRPYPEGECPVLHALHGGASVRVDDEVFWRADGTAFPVEYTCVPLVKDDTVVGAVTTFTDISARRLAELEVNKLSLAVTESPVAVVITDADRIIDYVSPAFERASGFCRAEAVGQLVDVFLSPREATGALTAFIAAMRAGTAWRGELSGRRRTGDPVWVRVVASPVTGADGNIRHFVIIMEDVSVEHAQAELIRYQAEYDTLTGVPNRALTIDRIGQAINKARRAGTRVGLLFIDLDDFKKINDTLGHEVGDQLLVEAANRFRAVVREGDTVGRHGGDEFLILIEDIDTVEVAERVARDVVRDFATPFRIHDIDMLVTASVGIALFPADGRDTTTLLRNADAAMYTAKAGGRNNFSFFAPEMNRAAVQRVTLEHHLLGALQRNEFSLCFQPQVALTDGRVEAVEALLRWNNPGLGTVRPAEFLPLAEQTGIIVAIGNWVIDEALRMLAGWRRAGWAQLRVAVNVSPRQFQSAQGDRNLADVIDAALVRYDLPAQALELEITEGLLIRNWVQTRPLLDRLHGAGVRIVMDDFGTGYSSLATLRSFPFDALKIDGSFIRDLADKAEDRTLVSAIVAMAGSLGVAVVAEGVETEVQRALLREHGCRVAQGNLFGAPMNEVLLQQHLGVPSA